MAEPMLAWFASCDVERRGETGVSYIVNYVVAARTKIGASRAACAKVRRSGGEVHSLEVYQLRGTAVGEASSWRRK